MGDEANKRYIINGDERYDIETISTAYRIKLQVDRAHRLEREFAELITGTKFELKSEQWLWERTGNMAVEFRNGGKPSGIALTEAGVWVEHLLRDGVTLCWILFPIERIKELARHHYRLGHWKPNCGVDGCASIIKIPFQDILR